MPAATRAQQIGIDAEVKVPLSSDVIEGDLLNESSTSTKMFVFQIQQETNSKICLCLEVSTDVIKRQRAATADLTLDAAWFYPQSAGFESDINEGARQTLRVRRAADVIEGDTIYNQTINKSWSVYEVLHEQLTKLCLARELTGQSVTRTRTGAADVNISPAWIRVLRTGQRKVIGTLGAEIGITAEVRVPSSADVVPGDFLYYAAKNLRLLVYQVIPEQSTLLCMCQQVPQFIPDEFDRSIIEAFWTQSLAGGTAQAQGLGLLEITVPTPATQVAGNGAFIFQVIKGDFDVYARLDITNTGLAGAQVAYGLLGARLIGTSTGVYIGNRGKTAAPGGNVVVIDQYGASAQDEILGPDGEAMAKWVRLQRRGSVFYCYYSSQGGVRGPSSEQEWTFFDRSATIVSGSGDVQLGICGYKSSGAGSSICRSEWIRNWQATSFATRVKGTPISNRALTGSKDGVNKSFTIPESFIEGTEVIYWNGQRQIRGDDYTISGSTITFSASHPAPASGDTLIADYLLSTDLAV